jgi:hypothetical protein
MLFTYLFAIVSFCATFNLADMLQAEYRNEGSTQSTRSQALTAGSKPMRESNQNQFKQNTGCAKRVPNMYSYA